MRGDEIVMEKILLVGDSKRVKELEDKIKVVKERYQRILVEDRK